MKPDFAATQVSQPATVSRSLVSEPKQLVAALAALLSRSSGARI